MLNTVSKSKHKKDGGHYAIGDSKYNAAYVDAMLNAAKAELKQSGAEPIEVIRVPGAYEIPLVAAKVAGTRRYSAIICLGVILRGQTVHADYIGRAVTEALM